MTPCSSTPRINTQLMEKLLQHKHKEQYIHMALVTVPTLFRNIVFPLKSASSSASSIFVINKIL